MGLDPVTLAGIGTGINTASNLWGRYQEGKRRNKFEGQVRDELSGLGTAGFLENLLRSQFNVGQDGGMQTLRAMPGGAAIEELAATGMPFDLSELYESLQPLRQRQTQMGLGELRGGASGIGQRFGSAMMKGEENLVRELLESYAAQDAATAFQAHEGAQGRRLQAGALGVGTATGLMELLAQLETNRGSQRMQALGLLGGIPGAGPMNLGQPMIDIGQLKLLQQLLNKPVTSPGTTQIPQGTEVPIENWPRRG